MSAVTKFSDVQLRKDWGARHRNGFGARSIPVTLWLHHTVTTHLPESATVAQERAQMRVLEDIGQQRFGGGVSYNWILFPSGRLYQGIGVRRRGAHTLGHNVTGMAVALAGNYQNTPMTEAQIQTLAWFLPFAKKEGWIREARFNGGHRDAPGNSTACPGNRAHAQIAEVHRRVAGGSASPASSPTKPKPSTAAQNLARSKRMTSWPARPLPVRDFPRGTYWLQPPRSNAPVVPNEYRHALVVALAEAGYPYRERTVNGAFAQIRSWLRGQHGYRTGTPRLSIGADFQRYLTRQGVYTGAIDGYLGPQSIWAITTWLNKIRPAYR